MQEQTTFSCWSSALIKMKLYLCFLGGFALLPALSQSTLAHTSNRTLLVNSIDANQKPTPVSFKLLKQKDRPWRICVFFPHLKDSYWSAVNYGVSDEAKRIGVEMHLYRAGGYSNLATQIQQIRRCVAERGQGMVIASTSLDGLNPLIKDLHKQGIPVVDLINGISSPLVSARSAASFSEMGKLAGNYIANRAPAQGKTTIKVAWFPGPKTAGWAQNGDKGFQDALQGSAASVVSTSYGDTNKAAQTKIIEEALHKHPDIDYIAGTAVTAEVAIKILRKHKLQNKIGIVAYYFSPGIYRGIRRGNILAAPTDFPIIQARIAMTQIVQILEGNLVHKHISPPLQMIDQNSISNFDHSTSLAPSGFRPSFVINR